MHLLAHLTRLLTPSLLARNPGNYDQPQYTQAIITTVIPSWTLSYWSTDTITLTSTMPCPVTTTYTTAYVCEHCTWDDNTIPVPPPICTDPACNVHPAAGTTCSSYACIGAANHQPTPTTFLLGASATAVINDGHGASYTTFIDPNLCTGFFAFVTQQYAYEDWPVCAEAQNNDGGDCTPTVVPFRYTTDGGYTIAGVTTLPGRGCGPYNTLRGEAVGRGGGSMGIVRVVAWAWAGVAVFSGVGMVLL